MTALGAFVYYLFSEEEEEPQPVRAEVVSIPDLPPPDPLQVNAGQQVIPLIDEKELMLTINPVYRICQLLINVTSVLSEPEPPEQIAPSYPTATDVPYQMQGLGANGDSSKFDNRSDGAFVQEGDSEKNSHC